MMTTIRKTETDEELKAPVARVAVPSKMTAAVLYGSEDLRIEMIDVPSLAADEVLLRVRLALTDGTDLKVWTQPRLPASTTPRSRAQRHLMA